MNRKKVSTKLKKNHQLNEQLTVIMVQKWGYGTSRKKTSLKAAGKKCTQIKWSNNLNEFMYKIEINFSQNCEEKILLIPLMQKKLFIDWNETNKTEHWF